MPSDGITTEHSTNVRKKSGAPCGNRTRSVVSLDLWRERRTTNEESDDYLKARVVHLSFEYSRENILQGFELS